MLLSRVISPTVRIGERKGLVGEENRDAADTRLDGWMVKVKGLMQGLFFKGPLHKNVS